MSKTESTESRIVIVTGGNSGIGYAVAEMLAEQGDTLILFGRNEQTLVPAASKLGAEWFRVDIRRTSEIAEAVDAVALKHGRIDVLINCAGVIRKLTVDTSLEEAERVFDEVVQINLRGSYLMSVACAKHMPRGGRMINVGSIAGFTGGRKPGLTSYAASKTGLHGITYSLARELGPRGITVNLVSPGFIQDTSLFGPEPAESSEQRARQQAQATAVGRAGVPGDIAAAVRYLASPEASFVTGELLQVTGGSIFGR